ncbi:hypothetical protein [Magnetospira sp. QH-2]|uniref:hypothetical protein n=1 Tax=Magnetospira sp. (strain QH-2) TaxID=1288970 RepID=UPI0005FA5E09|nr:hypothetical protein [Magnetospira sp. QH-2]
MVFRLRRLAIGLTGLFGIWAAVASLDPAAARESGPAPQTEEVRLGDRIFHIPNTYLEKSSHITAWLRWMPGLDDGSRSMLMEIDADEVAASVQGYITRNLIGKENINLNITVLTPIEVERYTYPSWVREIVTKTESYKRRIIEPDPGTGYFRAYREIEYDRSWDLLKFDPDNPPQGYGHFSNWVAGCRKYHATTATGVLAGCSSYTLFDNIYVHFRVREENIHHADAIRVFLEKLVGGWVVK